MKNYNMPIIKRIISIIVLTALTAMSAAALDTTTTKKRWLFGTAAQQVATFDQVWSTSTSESDYLADQYGLKVERSTTIFTTTHNADYLFDQKCLLMSIKVVGPGKLTISARQRNDSDENGGKARTVTVSDGDNTYTSGAVFNNAYAPVTAVIDIDQIAAGATKTLTFSANSAAIGWYSIMWTPAGAVPEAVTMSAEAEDNSINVFESTTVSAVLRNALDNVVTPTGAITFSSNNTSVATVNATTGEVLGVGGGTATITASFAGDSDYAANSATVNITVNKLNVHGELTVPSPFFEVGDDFQVTVVWRDDNDQVVHPATSYMPTSAHSTIVQATNQSGSYHAYEPGVVEIIANIKGSETVYKYAKVSTTVTVLPHIIETQVKRADGTELSTLGGTAMGLTTNYNNTGQPSTYDLDGKFGVYDSNNQRYYGSATDITVTNLTLTSNRYVSSATPTTTGVVGIKMSPYPTDNHYKSIYYSDLVATNQSNGSATYDGGTRTATFTDAGQRIGWNFASGYWDGSDYQYYKYFKVEIEPTASAVQIAAEYSDGTYNYKEFPAGTRFIYVPLSSVKTLTRINIQRMSAGTLTFVPSSAEFLDSNRIAAYGEITGIVVTEPSKTALQISINPSEVTLEKGRTQALTVSYTEDGTSNVVNGLTTTYSSSNTAIATVSSSGVITAVSPGTCTITLSTAGDSSHNGISATVSVTVTKATLSVAITPSPATVKQGETLQMSVTYYIDANGNGSYDSGETTVSGLSTTWSASEFDKTDSISTTNAYIKINGSGKVTALNPGAGPGFTSGQGRVTAKFAGNNDYSAAQATVNVTVTDNTCFDYMGWDLQGGHSGTLYDENDEDKHYLHWRFGAPEGSGVYVFKYNNGTYEFTAEYLTLQSKVHTSEKSIDDFLETKLTDTQRIEVDGVQIDAKGDAFLEYNGMIAGYGTEKGGRYMTPVSGTFVRVEPEHDGVVTVRLRHNGSLDTSNYKTEEKDGNTIYKNITQARRALYVIDENGVVMPRTSNYSTIDGYAYNSTDYKNALKNINGTYCRISESSAVTSTFDVVNDAYTAFFNNTTLANYSIGSGNNQDFSKNAFHFCRNVIYSEYGDARAADFNADIRDGYHQQRLFYSDEEGDVSYQATGVASKTYFFSKYGYEVLGATHLVISFPVKAGKTYFVGANKSKIGLCSVEFEPSTSYSTVNKDLYEDATVANGKNSWLTSTADETRMNVTLHRKFTAYRWTPLILPFSVSESMLKSNDLFGPNVKVISLDGAMRMMSSMNNYATRDGDFYNETDIVTGQTRPFNGSVIKPQAIRDASVTFTRHYYQMIYANCPVFIWTDRDVTDPVFNNVTFQKFTLDKRDTANTPAINSDYSVTFPYFVDRQIGDGADYNYVMKASYVQTTPETDVYYMNNIGTGSSTTAFLCHAPASSAPTMKATRVWIEPADSRSLPLRTIGMEHFWGETMDFGGETSGIMDIVADQPSEVQMADENVYDITGRIVARGSLDGLSTGLYIFKGMKHFVK